MDTDDIIFEICQYFSIENLIKIKLINKSFNKIANQYLKKINNGLIDPNQYFDIACDMNNFDYPIRSFLNDDGYWNVNNKEITQNNPLSNYNISFDFTHFYFVQVGEHDEQDWVLIGKTKEYYVYFEASCDYTGFDCQGGGEYNYYKDWSVLWNRYINDKYRRLMLKHYGYQTFNIKF